MKWNSGDINFSFLDYHVFFIYIRADNADNPAQNMVQSNLWALRILYFNIEDLNNTAQQNTNNFLQLSSPYMCLFQFFVLYHLVLDG